jgi:hypothetical protein
MAVLHDYECDRCHSKTEHTLPFEQRSINCTCGGTAYRIVSFGKKARNIDIFEGQRFEHLGDDAPYISSKRELAQVCRERGIVSRMLEDGYRSYGPKKEI